MAQYQRITGTLIEPVGHLWVAFSPATGETILLNNESAAILEVLEAGTADTVAVTQALAADGVLAPDSVEQLVEDAWPELVASGLVREVRAGDTMPR